MIPNVYKKYINTKRINNIIQNDLLKEEFQQLIINEYKYNQGITAHIDHTKYFGPIIACLSIGSEATVIFSKDNKEEIITLNPGSLYIMTGESRYKWYHSIIKNPNKINRYSLTFRTII